MKQIFKGVVLLWALLLAVSLVSCNEKTPEIPLGGTRPPATAGNLQKTTETTSETEEAQVPTPPLTAWERAGKGTGQYLPEPDMDYDLRQWSEFIAAVIQNASEDDFREYVARCVDAGFDGTIGSATSPDFYFNGTHPDGYRVQVMYYADSMTCNISAFPPKT